jgi:uroporphyrinogen-III synthase
MPFAMPEYNIHILCTRPVEKIQVEKAKQKGISLEAFSFIETEAIQNIEIQQEIEWASVEEATVVFTSMNAVESVTGMLDGFVPAWSIYCMGHKTKQLVAAYFGEAAITDTADNASELADRIIENEEPEEIIFFCGNQRREELPVKLRSHGISVNEIIVYETVVIEHTVDKVYEGILFFSPSAVESFFSKNTLPEHTVLFAIGNTTAKTIHKHCNNRIMISDHPGKDELIEQAIAYFS